MKIVFRGYAHCAGTDYAFLEELPDNTSEKELDALAWEYAVENAEMYGDVTEEYPENEGETHYIVLDDIGGFWEVYNPDKHDGIL